MPNMEEEDSFTSKATILKQPIRVEGEWQDSWENEEEDEDSVLEIELAKVSSMKMQASKALLNPSQATLTEVEIEDRYETNPFFGLRFFPSALMATVLEDAIGALKILDQCNNEMRILKLLDDMPLLVAQKYGVLPSEDLDDSLDNVSESRLGCDEYKLFKLERDRKDCINLLSRAYMSLVLFRSFRSLYEQVVYVDEQKRYLELLEDQETKHKLHARYLMRNLRQQRNHNKSIKYDADTVMCNLKLQIGDADQKAAIRERYADKWQSARTNQHQEIIGRKEGGYLHNIQAYKERVEQEARVHHEIETLMSLSINETMNQVEEWMDKYDRDMEEIDLRIQIQRSEYQNIHDKRRDMERKYNKHDRQIREWIKFKEDRAQARKYSDDMTRSATIVQAWWRGLLVRKQLGPFRRHHKKGHKKR